MHRAALHSQPRTTFQRPAKLQPFDLVMQFVAQQLSGGRKVSGYFVSDLTLAQIKTLYATQSFPERDQSQDNIYRWVHGPQSKLLCGTCIPMGGQSG